MVSRRRPRNRCDCGRQCRGLVCSRCRALERHIKPRATRKTCLAANPLCGGRIQPNGYCRAHSARVARWGTVDGVGDYPSPTELARLRTLIPSLFPGQRFGPMTGNRMLSRRVT